MSRIALLAMVLALVASAASAEPRHRGGGWNGPHHGNSWRGPRYNPNPLDSFVGGMIGGAISSWFAPKPEPMPTPTWSAPSPQVAWCYQRYKSFDGYTYLGFDGLRHSCP